ncbi:MAG: lysophospholipid acyltransferase family protein [Smithellaceae bacterium]|nr:lysophospholipid acyltransferase family protein [Smithellaceae bacterium]
MLILWGYFLFGFLFILLFLFIPCYLLTKNSAGAIQKLFHLHMKFFFNLTGRLIPRTTYKIDPEVCALRSSVIVCNHLSYLDPILLVSLFPRQTTIIKKTFFQVPVFGWFMKKAGYVSSSPSEMTGAAMINHLESIKTHLAAGGNLFLFPEGTRSRDGRIGPFNKGVFSIARYCNTGLNLVYIQGTDKLFPPGSFLFRTREKNTITMELIATLTPDYSAKNFSINVIADQTRRIFEQKIAAVKAADPDRKI